MTKKLLLCWIPLLAAWLGACEREPRTAREELAEVATTDPGYRTEQPAPVVTMPDTAGGRTLMGNLVEMQNSGVSGTVTVRAENGATEVLLSVIGGTPNTSVVPTFHRGGCEESGQLVTEMEPQAAGTDGVMNATLKPGIGFESIADGRHSIRLYPEGSTAVPPLACADLPAPAQASPF